MHRLTNVKILPCMCTKYHFIMPLTWCENHHKLTTKSSCISTKHTYKTSTLYLSEDMCPHSTYMWHRSQTSNLISFIWFYLFLLSFSTLSFTIQCRTLYLLWTLPDFGLAVLLCALQRQENDITFTALHTHFCYVNILLLLCTVLTISISVRIV
jgi:hypothetical protein